jgi:hypothetical protein
MHATPIGTKQAGRTHEKCALPRPGAAGDDDDLSWADVKRDATQRLDRGSTVAEPDAISFVDA